MQVIFNKTTELSSNGSHTRVYDAGAVYKALHPQEMRAFEMAIEAGDAKLYDPNVYDRPIAQETKVITPVVRKMRV